MNRPRAQSVAVLLGCLDLLSLSGQLAVITRAMSSSQLSLPPAGHWLPGPRDRDHPTHCSAAFGFLLILLSISCTRHLVVLLFILFYGTFYENW